MAHSVTNEIIGKPLVRVKESTLKDLSRALRKTGFVPINLTIKKEGETLFEK